MARSPVLGLALLATVSAGAAVADREDGGVVLGPSMADVARSSPLTPNNSAMHFPMPIPVRALTFDATISSEAASTTNFEPRRVEAELPSIVFWHCTVGALSSDFSDFGLKLWLCVVFPTEAILA